MEGSRKTLPVTAAFVPIVVGLAVSLSTPARADTLDDIRARGVLIWGADEQGGGPYVFPRDDDPSQVTGFEVEVANILAKYMGVRAQFFEGDWDKLPDILRTKKVDIILNGFEWNLTRVELMNASIPYYVYGLQFLVAKGATDLNAIDDLRHPRADGDKRKIGVLGGSAAEGYVREHLGDAVEVINYDGNTDAMREVETGRLDATVQDTPIAEFYGPRFPKLRPIGAPTGTGYYVAFARKGDDRLTAAINEAFVLMIRNGDLERIYRKYGIWDAQQQHLIDIAEAGKFYGLAKAVSAKVQRGQMPTEEAVEVSHRKQGMTVVRDYAGILLKSAGMTAFLSVVSFPMAIFVGLLVAVGRVYGPRWLRAPLTAYVEFLRGTPLMLQLYFLFFFLPELGVSLPPLTTAILGLALNYSSYEAEIYRAGLQAIPRGQMEAALSLGMPRALAIRRIIVPQAVRIVIPPVMNDFISLFKDTSVCSVITVVELTKQYSILSMSTQATFELMLMTAVLYLMMSYPLSIVSNHLENRLGRAPAL